MEPTLFQDLNEFVLQLVFAVPNGETATQDQIVMIAFSPRFE
jgi:hypothetical protein